jgi:hypothetical protein
MKKFSLLMAIVVMFSLLSACASNESIPNTTSDENLVATIVAGTLSATTTIPIIEPTPSFTPEPPTVLAHSLYYQASESESVGGFQIYRLSRDGITVTQITYEPEGVGDFDISPLDGTIAYAAKDGLIAVNADGGNRRVLTTENISFPTWSPNGETIVYASGHGITDGHGIYIYTLATGQETTLIAARNDQRYERNLPLKFSPDGNKLIIANAGDGDYVISIYDLTSNTIIQVAPADAKGLPLACLQITWVDPNNFYCNNHFGAQGTLPGLWQVNANNGSNNALIFYAPVATPRQNQDGTLTYLLGEGNSGSPLTLIHSDADGVTNRLALRSETFLVHVAIWASDNNALVILQDDGMGKPTNLVLVPIDSSLPVINLLSDASSVNRNKLKNTLRWGP